MQHDPFFTKRYGHVVLAVALALFGLASTLFLIQTHILTNALLEEAKRSQIASPVGEPR